MVHQCMLLARASNLVGTLDIYASKMGHTIDITQEVKVNALENCFLKDMHLVHEWKK